MRKIVALFVVVVLFVGYIYNRASDTPSYSFYHWRSTYRVDANESQPPRYIKVLDIAYNSHFAFKKTSFKTLPLQKIVPVVYIDNPLWKKMKASTMVTKVLDALNEMLLNYYEIQVDCDWTDSSKNAYFKFLKLLKEKSAKKISVTIRLHQVKYFQRTGVPPVDYGVLMYYNMSDFQDIKTKNYILDLELAKQYHAHFEDYPLALNLALPLYSQATIIRFSKVVGLMEGVREEALNEKFKKIAGHLYEVTETHYFKKHLFYKGDKVRVDEVSVAMLQKTLDALKGVMKKPKEIIFYRWGNREHYEAHTLKDMVEF